MGGATIETNGCKLRSINEVLVEPGSGVAPPKRRRGKAKRSILKNMGNIKNYFSNIHIPKECLELQLEDQSASNGGARKGKRKGGSLEDGQTQCGMDGKSRKLMMETTKLTFVGDDFVLGAKSRIRVDPTGRHKVGARQGLELNSSTEKDGGRSLPIGPNDGTISDK